MLLHSLAPLARSSTFAALRNQDSSPLLPPETLRIPVSSLPPASASCTLRIPQPPQPPPSVSPLPSLPRPLPAAGELRGSPRDDGIREPSPSPNTLALVGVSPDLRLPTCTSSQPAALSVDRASWPRCRSRALSPLTRAGPSPPVLSGGSPQLRAAHVASASHRELLRSRPGWSTRHSSPSPHLHSTLLLRHHHLPLSRRASAPLSPTTALSVSSLGGVDKCGPGLVRSSSSGSPPRRFLSSPALSTGGTLSGGSDRQTRFWKETVPSPAVQAFLQNFLLASSLDVSFPTQPLTSAWVGSEESKFTVESEASTGTEEGAESGATNDVEEDTEKEEEGEQDWSGRRKTQYRVIRVPGDGRCLFTAVVFGHCHMQGERIPSSFLDRCERADRLRQLVADEFVKQREETEWFLEGPFEQYVTNIRRPHIWGGEPELLMLAHVLRYPITVYILDPRGDVEDEAIIAIAEYGKEYAKQSSPLLRETELPGAGKGPISLLYNGYNHYDAVILQ